ncbi:hypothetical protein [Pseudoalteromonas phage vB_PtuP_Slicky01]|nr:hypothetical protein [Pseudoalteromonas phage vB_PtuP_Slicky01]
MAVYCPNNGITYANLRLWIDAVRDTDFGDTAVAFVNSNETYGGTNPLHFVGSWPYGFRVEASAPFNGIYSPTTLTTLTFEGPSSVVIDINSGNVLRDKLCEITGFIINHRGQGIEVRDNRDYLDVRIHENFVRSTGNNTMSTWLGTNNILVSTHSLTTAVSINNNICFGAAREAIKTYMNYAGNGITNLGINNNVCYSSGREADAYPSVRCTGGGTVDLQDNLLFPSGATEVSKAYDISAAIAGNVSNNGSNKTTGDILVDAIDVFTDVDALDFRVKTNAAILLTAPNIGAFHERVTGKLQAYSVTVNYSDFTQVSLPYKQASIQTYYLDLTINQEGDVVAAGYTRQSSFMDGDVILASHGNLEFDQLARAFAADTGHNHDGGEGSGGIITRIGNIEGSLNLTMNSQGIGGSVVLDDDTFTNASQYRLATQRSTKNYVLARTSPEFTKQQVLANPNTKLLTDEEYQKVIQLPPIGSDLLTAPPADGKTYAQKDGLWQEIPSSIEQLTLQTNNVSRLKGYNTSGTTLDVAYVSNQDKIELGDVSANLNLNGSSLTFNSKRVYSDDNLTYRVYNDSVSGDISLPSRYKESTVVIVERDNNIILNPAASKDDVVIVHKKTKAGVVTISGGSIKSINEKAQVQVDPQAMFEEGTHGSVLLICTDNPDGLTASWFIQQQ